MSVIAWRVSAPAIEVRGILSGVAAEVRAQADRWFVWAPVSFGAGCGVYFALSAEPSVWIALVLAVAAIAAATTARTLSRNRAVVIALSLVAFGACGFLAAKARTLGVAAPVVWQRTTGTVEGWVVDVAGPGSGGGRLLIAPYRIDGLAPDRLPARVRLTVGPDGLIGPGEAVRLRAIVGPPPDPASPGAYDFARDAFFQGVGGVGFTLDKPMIVAGPRPPAGLNVLMAVNAARWSLARRMIDDMGVATGGIAVAMTTGHEAWLQPADVQSMRDSGLTHILSISGVHMAIVGGFVFLLMRSLIALWPWLALRIPGKKVAAGGALFAVGVYLIVSGAPAPAVRSAVTLSVAFAAVLFDRRAVSLHALAVAALIVLVLQPEAVAQPGFQMSFAATAALIAMAEAWPHPVRELKVPWPIRLVQGAMGWLAVAIAASFVAGAATEPFAIQHFNRVSIYGLPANLLMEPLSTILIMPALAVGALMEAMGAGGDVLKVAGFGIHLLTQLSAAVAHWPVAAWIVPSAPDVALPIAFVGVLGLCLWRGRIRWLFLPLALAVSIWPRPAPPVAWIASDGGGAAITERDNSVFLRPDAKKFASDLWAKRRGLTEPKDGEAVMQRHFDCNRLRCFPTAPDAVRLSAWWTKRRPNADDLDRLCAGADIVIFRAQAPPGWCPAAAVLTAADFDRGGSVEIYRAEQGWRYVWANDLRGARPWTEAGQR